MTLSCLLPPDKTVKLWKVSERDKRPEGYNLKDEDGRLRDPSMITVLRVSAGTPRLQGAFLFRGLDRNRHRCHLRAALLVMPSVRRVGVRGRDCPLSRVRRSGRRADAGAEEGALRRGAQAAPAPGRCAARSRGLARVGCRGAAARPACPSWRGGG